MNLRVCGVVLAAVVAFPAWSQAPETPKLRIATIPIAGMTPLYAANKLGYFKDAGLEVAIDFTAGGAQSLPLVMQGTLQLSNGPIVSVALAHQQGFDLRLIGPTLDDKRAVPGQTASLVKADGPVKSVADLKGKRLGVNVINSVNWLYDRAFVQPYAKGAEVNANDVIDRAYGGLVYGTEEAAYLARQTQSGRLRWYMAGIAIGAAIGIALVVYA